MTCIYCGKEVLNEKLVVFNHKECNKEYNRRVKFGLCIICGERKAVINNKKCYGCYCLGFSFTNF